MRKPLRERFHSNVRKTRGCWFWTGAKDQRGYGVLKVWPKMIKAHRISWTLFRGEIPKGSGYHGTMVIHSCDNPACVNPRHLRLGTALDNAIDREVRGRGKQTKLNKKTVLEIRTLNPGKRAPWGYLTFFSEIYGVSKTTLSAIWKNKSWRYV